MRGAEGSEARRTRQHHGELILVVGVFVLTFVAVLQHAPARGRLLQGQMLLAARRVGPLEQEIRVGVIVDSSHGDRHLARWQIRPPARLDRDRVRHLPDGIARVAVEPRRSGDARDNERTDHRPVDADQRHGDGADGHQRRARRGPIGQAWRDDREESTPAGHQHMACDMDADVADQTPGHATVECGDGRLRHDCRSRIHQRARASGGEHEHERQPGDQHVDRLPAPPREGERSARMRLASNATRRTSRLRLRKTT